MRDMLAGDAVSGLRDACLEHAAHFLAPARDGDVRDIEWTFARLEDKPRLGAGIVSLVAQCRNQHAVAVADANGRMMV